MECTGLSTPSWLAHQLFDTHVTDICLNGTHGVFIDRGAGLEPLAVPDHERFREDDLRDWVLTELSAVGKTWDARHPFIDATLRSGHRVHVAFPPLTSQGILVSLRRLPGRNVGNISNPRESGWTRWKFSPLYQILQNAVKKGESILVAGATGSGKTTLTCDLLSEIPEHERVIALEDTPELAPQHPHFLSLISRPPNADGYGEVTLRTLLKQTLRMRPDRIVLGECRGTEVLELLQALNTGHRGALATLHANSPRDALRRIELLCLLASGGSIPLQAIRELLSLGIDWVVQVKREGAGRKIHELWRIEGREGDTILMRQVLDLNYDEYRPNSISC